MISCQILLTGFVLPELRYRLLRYSSSNLGESVLIYECGLFGSCLNTCCHNQAYWSKLCALMRWEYLGMILSKVSAKLQCFETKSRTIKHCFTGLIHKMALELYGWKNKQQMWIVLIISWQNKASRVTELPACSIGYTTYSVTRNTGFSFPFSASISAKQVCRDDQRSRYSST